MPFQTSARRLYLPSQVYQGIQTMAGLDTEILAHVMDRWEDSVLLCRADPEKWIWCKKKKKWYHELHKICIHCYFRFQPPCSIKDNGIPIGHCCSDSVWQCLIGDLWFGESWALAIEDLQRRLEPPLLSKKIVYWAGCRCVVDLHGDRRARWAILRDTRSIRSGILQNIRLRHSVGCM